MLSENAQAEKRRLRREMLEKRRRLSTAEVDVKSKRITEHLCSWEVYLRSRTIMIYLAMPDEPQTELLIKDALRRNKQVGVPLLGDKYGEMTVAEILSLDELVTGKLGLKMPNPEKSNVILPTDIDLVVVPAVAFDLAGNRLGMGAGYYDRFLPQTRSDAVLLGLTWNTHVVGLVPSEEHDVRMQCLVTENGFLPCLK